MLQRLRRIALALIVVEAFVGGAATPSAEAKVRTFAVEDSLGVPFFSAPHTAYIFGSDPSEPQPRFTEPSKLYVVRPGAPEAHLRAFDRLLGPVRRARENPLRFDDAATAEGVASDRWIAVALFVVRTHHRPNVDREQEIYDELDVARVGGGRARRLPHFCQEKAAKPLAIEGSLLAYPNNCHTSGLNVVDLAHPSRKPVRIAGQAHFSLDDFQIAGRFLYVASESPLQDRVDRVYQRQTGRLLYSFKGVGAGALAPDGRLFFAYLNIAANGSEQSCELGVLFPSQPGVRPLARDCGLPTVLDGGRRLLLDRTTCSDIQCDPKAAPQTLYDLSADSLLTSPRIIPKGIVVLDQGHGLTVQMTCSRAYFQYRLGTFSEIRSSSNFTDPLLGPPNQCAQTYQAAALTHGNRIAIRFVCIRGCAPDLELTVGASRHRLRFSDPRLRHNYLSAETYREEPPSPRSQIFYSAPLSPPDASYLRHRRPRVLTVHWSSETMDPVGEYGERECR